ncbi:hypothetical protein GBA65_11095 [Rubrobacter marinus]|uniref:Uncharacterized protein n=1 Tax=Rubrobacter marinus TaxID=2653852 RepID=A0A6G8PXX1_9ACTN|nr:hypothetical protein [Rubrobacter marinus]QIN78977.1 hypothetical protein GBA65_11095 [Rubrobacter marinus]
MSDPTDYTYLTLPPGEAVRSCIGLVVAGMAARGKIGVGGLEEAVELLEDRHSNEHATRYRFSLVEDRLLAEVEEQRKVAGVAGGTGEAERGWRTVVELVS